MWMVLSDRDDACARWLISGLRVRGVAPLRLVTAAELGPSARWEHRVGAGGASVRVCLGDGTEIRSKDVRGVVNRLTGPPAWFQPQRVDGSDQEYAREEVFAFFLSWLACLGDRMINRPTPQGLAGRQRSDVEWKALAVSAGLPTPTAGLGVSVPSFATLVVGSRVVADEEPSLDDACRRLSALAATPILAVEFRRDPAGRPMFAGAVTTPDLRRWGPAALDALVAALPGRQR